MVTLLLVRKVPQATKAITSTAERSAFIRKDPRSEQNRSTCTDESEALSKDDCNAEVPQVSVALQ